MPASVLGGRFIKSLLCVGEDSRVLDLEATGHRWIRALCPVQPEVCSVLASYLGCHRLHHIARTDQIGKLAKLQTVPVLGHVQSLYPPTQHAMTFEPLRGHVSSYSSASLEIRGSCFA